MIDTTKAVDIGHEVIHIEGKDSAIVITFMAAPGGRDGDTGILPGRGRPYDVAEAGIGAEAHDIYRVIEQRI